MLKKRCCAKLCRILLCNNETIIIEGVRPVGHQMSENAEAYISRFYEPKINAYEFLKGFFACLKRKGMTEINRDLVGFLYEQKKVDKYREVLEEVRFRSNGVNYYSDDVDDALFNLQIGGLLGKMNPSFGVIIIKYTDEEITETLESTASEYLSEINDIADTYVAMFDKRF